MSEFKSRLYDLLQVIDNPQHYKRWSEYEEAVEKEVSYYIADKWEAHVDEDQPDPHDIWKDKQLTNEE